MTLKMICFNGMTYTMKESDATFADLGAVIKRRRAQGYEVTRLTPYKAEVNCETCLINDDMGWLVLAPEKGRSS